MRISFFKTYSIQYKQYNTHTPKRKHYIYIVYILPYVKQIAANGF